MKKRASVKNKNVGGKINDISSSIIELLQDAVIVIDENQNILFFNQGAEKIFGYKASEVQDQPLGILLPLGLTAIHDSDVRKFIESPDTSHIKNERSEISGRRKNGVIFPAEATITKIPGNGGMLLAAILQDITERKMAEQAMRQNAEKYSKLLNSVDEIVYQVNYEHDPAAVNGIIEFVSEHTTGILGFRPSEFISNPNLWFTLIHPEDIPSLQAQTTKIMTEAKPGLRFYRIKDINGEYHSIEDRVSPEKDKTGQVTRIFGVARDNTEKTNAEMSLRQSEEKYRMLVDQASDGIFVFDTAGIFVEVNSRACEMLGYTRSEIMKMKFNDLLKPDSLKGISFPLEEFQHSRTILAECSLVCKNGDPVFAEVSMKMLQDGLLQAIVRDITQRKLLEKEIVKLHNAVEQSADIIFITDHNGIIEYANPAFEVVTGYSKAEAVGRSPNILSSGMMGSKYDQIMWETILSNEVYRGEVIDRKKSGEVFYYDQTITPVKDTHGNITSFVSTGKDVTERKLAEEQINRRVLELETLYQSGLGFSQTLDPRDIAEKVVEVLIGHLNWHHVTVRVRRENSDEIELLAFSRSDEHEQDDARIRSVITHIGQGMAGWVIQHGQIIRSGNVNNDPRYVETYTGMKSGLYVPLKVRNKTIGCISVESSESGAFTEDNERITFTLANQAASALENARLFKEIEMAYNATIAGWSQAMDLRDKETEGHTQRVTKMTIQMCLAMGLSESEIIHIQRGALLHDIGKMGVPDHILLKPGKLTDEEWEIMKKHPTFAHDMLSPISYLKPALDIPFHHHEKWDGTGYPLGLQREEIPVAARLFAVVDVYDALKSDRPYRKGWQEDQILEHIRSLSGTHFDPQVVDIFLSNIDKFEER
ncbi:MAG: PAS domain S-box protein [Chloroflexi bacterium]|nr:PAS domain S-box protein [Chloroflexota bacterium]